MTTHVKQNAIVMWTYYTEGDHTYVDKLADINIDWDFITSAKYFMTLKSLKCHL